MHTQEYIRSLQDRASAVLKSRLEHSGPARLLEEAVRYAVHNGGKRIRPVLAYASAETVGGSLEDADNCACAVELIHAYSLVHDDLPAMDDDELRRGQPTCHVRYGEAMAILAGDALQSLAFAILAESAGGKTPEHVLEMISTLANAAGWHGMVAGQSIDIEGSGRELDEAALAQMHRLKTGALIDASVRLGALSTGKASRRQLDSLEIFSGCLGLAFQIKDDILDVEGETEILGKHKGKDASRNKPTYPALLGLDGARTRMQDLYEEGTSALSIFGAGAGNLTAIAAYIINRRY